MSSDACNMDIDDKIDDKNNKNTHVNESPRRTPYTSIKNKVLMKKATVEAYALMNPMYNFLNKEIIVREVWDWRIKLLNIMISLGPDAKRNYEPERRAILTDLNVIMRVIGAPNPGP